MGEVTAAPKRQIGFWTALALVVGNIIGSGIFLLPANLAPYGFNAIVGWLVTIAGAMCLAAVFAALARARPRAEGPYDYVRDAVGEGPAFFVMWSYWISIWTTNAAVSVAAVSYLSSLAPSTFAIPGLAPAAAISFVILFASIAVSGVRSSGAVQIVTSILKVMPLIAAVIIAALVLGRGGAPVQVSPEPVSLGGVSATVALTLWAMVGFESATVPAARVRNPEHNIPRATLLGTLIAGLIYLAASSAVFMLLPAEQAAQSSAPFADLVGRFWGSAAGTMVVLFAAISCLGALNGWVFLQGEVPMTLAHRGVFPQWFGRLNRRGMPARALVTGAGLSIALIAANYTRGLTDLFGFMALLSTVATLVLYVVGAFALLRLMARREAAAGILTLVTLLGAAYGLWAFVGAGAEAVAWGAVLLATGVPVYLLMRWRAGSSRAEEENPAAPRGSSASASSRSS